MRCLALGLLATLTLAACDDDGGPRAEGETDAQLADAGGSGGDGGEGEGGAGGAGGVGGDGGAGGQGGEGGAGGQGGEGGAPLDCADAVPTSVDVVALGNVAIENGKSAVLEVTLPEDVISLTLVAVEATDANYIGVGLLEGPEGQVLVSENPPGGVDPIAQFASVFPGPFSSPNRYATAATGVAGLLAPNNPAVAVSPGIWQVQLLAANGQGRPVSTEVALSARIKRAASLSPCGVLDVHLFFSGSRDLTAANAPTDDFVQGALARMETFYAGIGIQLGEITYDDATGPQVVDATGGPGSDLHAFFAQGRYASGVQFFFVDRITSPLGGGATIAGIAGGTPGPTDTPETVRSGVVLATSATDDPKAMGHVMGHEAGHFLGLYHTQEFIGIKDQFDDTPEGDAGQVNIMYPTVTPEDVSFSAGQGAIIRGNASVKVP